MNAVIKMVLFITVFGVALIAGYRLFNYLNNRIKESTTGKELLLYAALLFITCAFVFMSAILLLIILYDWMSTVE
jgi:predicted MFS family arabinose efflux permease